MQKYLVAFCLLIISACSSLVEKQSIRLAEGVFWLINEQKSNYQFEENSVLLTVHYQENGHQMLVTIESGIHGNVVAAVSPQGVSIFELVVMPDGVIKAQRFLPIAMEPEYILTDMQLIHLPINVVQQRLTGANANETMNDGFKRRSIEQNGSPLIIIDYLDHKTVFQHLQRNYQLIIEDIE